MSGLLNTAGFSKGVTGTAGRPPKGTVAQSLNATATGDNVSGGSNYSNRIAPVSITFTAQTKNPILIANGTSLTGSSGSNKSTILSFEHNVNAGSWKEWGKDQDGTNGIMYSYWHPNQGLDIRRAKICHGNHTSNDINAGDIVIVRFIGWRWHNEEVRMDTFHTMTVSEIVN